LRSTGQNWSLESRAWRLRLLQRGDLHKRCGRALEQVAVFGIDDVRLRPGTIDHNAEEHDRLVPELDNGIPRRPLLTRLIAPRGLAMRLYLTALYDVQVRQRPGSVHTNDRLIWPTSAADIGWVGLLAVTATVSAKGRSEMDNRVRQVKSAIDRLVREGAAFLPHGSRSRNRFENFLLSNDGGVAPGLPAESSYITPRRNEGISIPVEFFTNNWVHCLTDSEIALWISFRLLAREHPLAHKEAGIFMTESTRTYRFGLTRDAYEAHTTLRRFGLIIGVDNVPRWRAGRAERLREQGLVEPLRFRLNDRMLNESAIRIIGGTLGIDRFW
jgi:hypothetical protein